jgi:hypothetical protein
LEAWEKEQRIKPETPPAATVRPRAKAVDTGKMRRGLLISSIPWTGEVDSDSEPVFPANDPQIRRMKWRCGSRLFVIGVNTPSVSSISSADKPD